MHVDRACAGRIDPRSTGTGTAASRSQGRARAPLAVRRLRTLVAVLAGLTLVAACSTTVAGAPRPDPVVAAGLHLAEATATAAPADTAPTDTAPAITQPTGPPTPTTHPVPSTSPVPGAGGVTGPETSTSSPGGISTSTGSTTTPERPPAPTQADASELFDALTTALIAHDRSAFVHRFTGSATKAAGQWWDNLAAIGFDGGAVGTYRNRGLAVALDADGIGTVPIVLAGVHAASDRVSADGEKYVPSTAYRWTVKYAAGRLQVTGWTSLQHAPWDCGCRLHIARNGTAVVGAYPDEAELADRVVDNLADAINWSSGFADSVAAAWPALPGAVAFVTAQPKRMAGWLRTTGNGSDDDDYWAKPPPAYTYYLPGYDGPATGLRRGDDFAGARMVLGPDGLEDTTEQVVHELVHYRLSTEATANGFLTVNAWVEEGIAQMVQQIYVGTPAEAAAAGQWVFGTRELGVGMTAERLAADFRGKPPTAAQLYAGNRETRFFWYQVAASFYNYLAVRYGLRVSIDVATAAHGGYSPFTLVPDPDRPSHMLRPADVQRAWAAWVRDTYG